MFSIFVWATPSFAQSETSLEAISAKGMKTDLRRAIIGNSRIKISGKNELNSLRLIAAETGASLDELQSLDTGEFHIKAGKAPSVAVQVPMIGKKLRISEKELEQRMDDQIERFYRRLESRQSTNEKDSEQTEPTNSSTPKRRVRRPAYSVEE